LPTLTLSPSEPDINEDIVVKPVVFTDPDVFATKDGIEPVPLLIILITFANDALELATCVLYVPLPKL
jgi:hypothetical protein